MSGSETTCPSNVEIKPLTEARVAELFERQGLPVSRHHGRRWIQKPRGFYHSLHWLARHNADQARKPSALCWGYRTTLHESAAHLSNGSLPVHLLTDVGGYDMQALPSKRRNQLRKCLREVEIVALTGPALLREQGHAVMSTAMKRIGAGPPPTVEQYNRANDESFGSSGSSGSVCLAGLVDGRLAGYLVGRAIESSAYVDNIYLDTEMLGTNVGTGLVYEYAQICRRCESIREMAYGLHMPEDDALHRFKDGMGFPVVHVPLRWWINPLCRMILRRLRPHVYYRLIGRTNSE
jgi:hypothetical protein